MVFRKISALVLCILLSVFCVIPCFAAEETASSGFIADLKNPDGKTLGIAFRGETDNYPENSLEGIAAAAQTGIDAVYADVKQTRDGVLILFADDTTERMLKSDKIYTIGETDYKDIADLPLKNGEGGVYEETQHTIPTIDAALQTAKENGISLVFGTTTALLKPLSDKLAEYGMTDSTAVIIRDSVKNIGTALAECETQPNIIGCIRSNVIFAVTSYENGIEKLGGSAVVLKTTNRYGVNYYKSALSLLDGRLRAVADLSDMHEAGARADTEKWWDDLIGRGYSVIITREPALFSEYLERTAQKRALLTQEVEKAEAFPLPSYKKEIFNDYKKAYDDAIATAKTLLSDESSCCRDLSDAQAALSKAVNDLNLNYDELEEGTAGLNITPVSIFLCVFAVALVLSAQIYTYKKRKK